MLAANRLNAVARLSQDLRIQTLACPLGNDCRGGARWPKSPSGKFVWYEYMGNDLKAAVDFYTGVVGWSAKDAGMRFDFAALIALAVGI